MKETFSSEKEKITCKGAMEVAGTQPYERCNIAQYYTVNDVIPVPSFLSSKCLFSLSSQCVTLGSTLFSSCTLYALRICYPFPSFLSSQCVTLGSTLFSSWTLYAPRIFCSLHNLKIFLYLDPSVTHWDDRKKGYWDDTFQVSQITMFVQLYVKYWNDIK
ncbi:MAG: hypothetical protein ACEY3L_01870 [Wolbachia sp.]